MTTKNETTEQGQTEQAQQTELTKEQKDALVGEFFSGLFGDKPRDRRMEKMHRLDATLSAYD